MLPWLIAGAVAALLFAPSDDIEDDDDSGGSKVPATDDPPPAPVTTNPTVVERVIEKHYVVKRPRTRRKVVSVATPVDAPVPITAVSEPDTVPLPEP